MIGLLDLESDEWSDAVNVLGRKPRAAGMTASDERAGRFRFTADALARVKEGLCRDDEDPAAAGYAWMLWAASAKSALRIHDLRTAQLDGSRLCDASGDVLLGVLSPEAAGTCERLFKVRAVASSGRGEPALYAAAERAWDRASAELPDNARPLLGSARHLSVAVWRRSLDDAMLAVLLGEEESDLAVWGRGLDRGSDFDQHRPPLPPRLRGSKEREGVAAGFTLIEILVVLAVVTVLASIAGQYVGGQYRVARQEIAVGQIVKAARQVDLMPGRGSFSWPPAAAQVFRDISGLPEQISAIPAGTNANAVADGAYVGVTTSLNASNLNDAGGTPVTITGCPLQSVQLALYPPSLPAGNSLSGVAAEWINSRFVSAGFESVVQDSGVFACVV